jgi:hypothetical protein
MKPQGKRPEQIKYSEDVSFYASIGLIVMLIIISLFE